MLTRKYSPMKGRGGRASTGATALVVFGINRGGPQRCCCPAARAQGFPRESGQALRVRDCGDVRACVQAGTGTVIGP